MAWSYTFRRLSREHGLPVTVAVRHGVCTRVVTPLGEPQEFASETRKGAGMTRSYSARPTPMHASPAQTTPAATARRCHCVRSRNTISDMAVARTMPALV